MRVFRELSAIIWYWGTRSDLHALNAATRIALISITYQSHRAGRGTVSEPLLKSIWQSARLDLNIVCIFLQKMREHRAYHSAKLPPQIRSKYKKRLNDHKYYCMFEKLRNQNKCQLWDFLTSKKGKAKRKEKMVIKLLLLLSLYY